MPPADADVLKKCKRGGCKKYYRDSENHGTHCKFHPGKPIFHDIKKGWDCCGRIVYDWADFENIEGCTVGPCSDQVDKADFWKSNTVSNAEKGVEKIKKMQTAEDFNKAEEERKRLAAAQAPKVEEKPKVPKKNKDGRFICANKGCTARTFTDEENGPEACKCHSGEPIFHDLKKYWSCCNPDGRGKVAYDWDEFQALPTCTVTSHKYKFVEATGSMLKMN